MKPLFPVWELVHHPSPFYSHFPTLATLTAYPRIGISFLGPKPSDMLPVCVAQQQELLLTSTRRQKTRCQVMRRPAAAAATSVESATLATIATSPAAAAATRIPLRARSRARVWRSAAARELKMLPWLVADLGSPFASRKSPLLGLVSLKCQHVQFAYQSARLFSACHKLWKLLQFYARLLFTQQAVGAEHPQAHTYWHAWWE